jgi:chemotaxis signal transduction protein
MAIIIHELIDVRSIHASDVKSIPSHISQTLSEFMNGVLESADGLINILNLERSLKLGDVDSMKQGLLKMG